MAARVTAFADLVETSQRVAGTASRNAKTSELARLLARLVPGEIPIAVAWLSGDMRQGRLGIGHALLRDAALGPPAREASLAIADVDRALAETAALTGTGSPASALWSSLMPSTEPSTASWIV